VMAPFVVAVLVRAGVLEQGLEFIETYPFWSLACSLTGRAGLEGRVCAAFEIIKDSSGDVSFPIAEVAAGENLDFHMLFSLKQKKPSSTSSRVDRF
jgi:hypothetical protein